MTAVVHVGRAAHEIASGCGTTKAVALELARALRDSSPPAAGARAGFGQIVTGGGCPEVGQVVSFPNAPDGVLVVAVAPAKAGGMAVVGWTA